MHTRNTFTRTIYITHLITDFGNAEPNENNASVAATEEGGAVRAAGTVSGDLTAVSPSIRRGTGVGKLRARSVAKVNTSICDDTPGICIGDLAVAVFKTHEIAFQTSVSHPLFVHQVVEKLRSTLSTNIKKHPWTHAITVLAVE